MALAARDLKNDDTTDAGFDLILDGITSPVTGDVGVTRIDVGTGTTLTRMDSSNPLFVQLTAGTAEVGKLAAGVAEIGNVKNSGTFVVQEDGAALTALQKIDDVVGTVGSAKPTEAFLMGGDNGTNMRAAYVELPVDGGSITYIGVYFLSTVSHGVMWTGSAYVSVLGNATDGMLVNLGANNDVSISGTVTVDLGANNDVTIDASAFVFTDDTSTHSTGTTKVVGIGAVAVPTDGSVDANDIAMPAMSVDRRLHVDAQIVGTDSALDVSGATVTVSNAGLTELAAAINASKLDIDIASSTVDVMLGTDFSNVFGTASLVLTTQADNVANTSDGLQTTSFSYAFDGSTWDRMRGDSTDGLLVNLGGNNDVTITGTVTVDLGANNDVTIDPGAVTSLALIDDVVFTHDAAATSAIGNLMMAQRDDEVGSTATTTDDGDATVLTANKFGQLKVTGIADATSEIKYAIIDAALSPDNTIQAAAGAGIKIRVLSLFLVAAGTVIARFESGTGGTALTGQMNLVANSGFTLPFNPGGWFETADDTLLNLELSATVSVDGCVSYIEV